MFNKLRTKLTITNVIVVIIIFSLFVFGVFLSMRKIANDQNSAFISLISSNIEMNGSQEISEQKDVDELQYRYFYVVFNTKDKVVASSLDLNMKNKNIIGIIAIAKKSGLNNGSLKWNDIPYNYVKTVLDNKETSFIFINTNSETKMLNNLKIVLVLISLAGLIIAFWGSLFMANRALIPIKATWKTQKEFIADASHELRTPLAVIETTLDLIISRGENTINSQLKWIENIQAENKRMSKLVNDLLFLARTDSDQVIFEKVEFPLHSALLEAYIPFEAITIQKGIQLKAFQGSPINFIGDESRIKQLVVILIDNAIKHTPPGGSIGMSLFNMGEFIEIIIEDTGEGIEKEHTNNIFKRFYKVDKSRSNNGESSGLGLSIAQCIVKEHNGTIKVESLKDKGSTFHINLPF